MLGVCTGGHMKPSPSCTKYNFDIVESPSNIVVKDILFPYVDADHIKVENNAGSDFDTIIIIN